MNAREPQTGAASFKVVNDWYATKQFYFSRVRGHATCPSETSQTKGRRGFTLALMAIALVAVGVPP